MNKKETRYQQIGEVRSEDAEKAPTFTGHAAVFNTPVAIGNPRSWGFIEEFKPGAFSRALEEDDVAFLVEHDSRLLVSRTSVGNLRLSEDSTGLAVDSDLDESVTYVSDMIGNIRSGNISKMSFAFMPRSEGGEAWSTIEWKDEHGEFQADYRQVTDVQLFDVSAVSYPAYSATDASLRSVASAVINGDPELIARKMEQNEQLSEMLHQAGIHAATKKCRSWAACREARELSFRIWEAEMLKWRNGRQL